MMRLFRRARLLLAGTLTVGGLLAAGSAPAQAPAWVLYNAGNAPIANDIREIRQEGSAMWVLGPTALYRRQAGQWTPFALPGLYLSGLVRGGRALHIDGQGTKWVGTSEETLRLDGQGTFSTVPLRYDDDIVADGLGNLFFVSAFDGLYRYDGTTPPTYLTGGGSGGLHRMVISGSTYWLITSSELVRYASNQTRRWSPSPAVFFSDLCLWNGLVWVASSQGLQAFSPTTTQFQPALTPANSPLPGRSVTCVLVDSQNALWAGTTQGLARYDGTTWQVFTTANSPLPVDDVRTLFEDGLGNLWIGTGTGGVAVYHAGGVLATPDPVAAPAPAFTIAPNPAAAVARLHVVGGELRRVVVVDALGRPVRMLDAPSAPAAGWEVPLAGLPAGRYTVCATFADGRCVRQALSKAAE